jgi:cell division transport system ATP-binding protein
MIQFYHVLKSYDRRQQALKDVSFRIAKGEFAFLTGASGAGKTTLLKLILCAELPDEGQILIAGRNVARLHQRDIPHLRRQIGIVFQDYKLIERKTVYENVALALRILGVSDDIIHKKTTHTLKAVGVYGKRDNYPLQLSGGEQQRVAIARALVKDPLILLADEPTGNLDSEVALEIMDLIKGIHAQGTTVIVATHDLKLTRSLAKRVLHLDRGQVT